jgi:hypothetical protein
VPGLHFVPWHRGSGCLGAAAPVTGAPADEYNLNVVDCNASVIVAPWSSISVSGGLGVPQPPAPEANVNRDSDLKWFSLVPVLCDFVTVEFVVTESSTGPRKQFREMIVVHVGGHD